MMIEWEDHGEEERRLLLQHLDRMKPQPATSLAPAPKPNWFWRLAGRIYLAYLRRRHRRNL